MNENLVGHVIEMLKLGRQYVQDNPILNRETGVVNAKGDHSIEMDLKIEELFIKYLKRNSLPVNIFSEEIGTLNFHPNPKFLVAFDPLDGSTNYKYGKGLLPFGTLITFYNGINPHLSDIITAAAIEYTRDLIWVYDGNKTIDLKGNPVKLKTDWQIHRSIPVYLDLYYREAYERYLPLAQQIFIRNTGSTIGNLSYVLSNAAAGLGSVCMRAEEIGTVFALIKGAGGVTSDHKGNNLDAEKFDPEKTYSILAGAMNIMEFAVKQMKSNRK